MYPEPTPVSQLEASGARSYPARGIMRPSSLEPGMLVTLLMGGEDMVASDNGVVYLVSDQQDKKGNPMLVDRESGATAWAGPGSIWAIW